MPPRQPGPELTSTRAPRVKAAQRLAKRAFRARAGRFLAEGPQAVREAVGRSGTVHELFVTHDAGERYADIVAAAAAGGAPVHLVSGEVMLALSQTVTPQGLVAVCGVIDVPLPDLLVTAPRLVAVLAHVRDPGNAGTVLRAADAAGAGGVVLTGDSVDPYNGKCVRASAGSLFHLPVVVGRDAADELPALRAAGLRVLAADGHADTDLDEATDSGLLDGPTAWVFGNEAWGLPPDTRALADRVVRVPIHGRAESLNLATAAAVCLYASARAHRAQPSG
ncbi:MAG TPA: RNA methyltransferase [Actinomycetes bacterium]|nr:RNA methyltransferase [Actinomycetes bacterium]